MRVILVVLVMTQFALARVNNPLKTYCKGVHSAPKQINTFCRAFLSGLNFIFSSCVTQGKGRARSRVGVCRIVAFPNNPSIFFLQPSRNRVDFFIVYEGKPTDKREQYDWMAEKN